MRTGNFDVVVEANCQSVVNPVLDTGKYLPREGLPENYGGYDDPELIESTRRCCTRPIRRSSALLMRAYETRIVDTRRTSCRCCGGTASSRRGPT